MEIGEFSGVNPITVSIASISLVLIDLDWKGTSETLQEDCIFITLNFQQNSPIRNSMIFLLRNYST